MTINQIKNGISQQWINQFLHDPNLREKGRHQVVKYLSDAATIRNDDFVVGMSRAIHVKIDPFEMSHFTLYMTTLD